MPPKLAELIAYCRANGIKGGFKTFHDPPFWRARVRVGMVRYSAPAATEDEALEMAAKTALNNLRDPMPQPGTADFVAWQERRRVARFTPSE